MNKPFKHGRSAYANGKCKCDTCTEANRIYTRQRREVYREQEPPKHGTAYSYSMYSCRCEPCRAAWRVKVRANRYTLRGLEPPRHGTNYIYNHYYCRCSTCKEAYSRYQKQRRVS